MLPKENRLKLPVKWNRSQPDFQIRTDHFKVIAKKTNPNESFKIGFIVTTKVGKATTRNRLKRKLSQLLGQKLGNLKGGLETIWILHPSIEKAKDEEISAGVDKVLPKLQS